MSVHVPIYQRILYGSPTTLDQERKKTQTPREQDKSFDQYQELVNPRSMPSELWDSTRLSLSVLSFHKTGQIIPRAISAPAVSFAKTTKQRCPQNERWKEREKNLTCSRTRKKKSNIIAHRQDKGYYISGSKLPLLDRYDIDEEELIKLRMLAQSRAERSTTASSVNSTIFQRRAVSAGTSPSGQNCSPVPPTLAVETEKRKKIFEKRSLMKDERERRKEMRLEREREKAERLEEKLKFEKKMEEKYKPRKPEKKSLIFVTEQSDVDKKLNQRVFLTESDFTIDGEGKSRDLLLNRLTDDVTEVIESLDQFF